MLYDRFENIERYACLLPCISIKAFLEKEMNHLAFEEWFELSPQLKVIKLNRCSTTEDFEFHKKYTDVHLTTAGVDEILLGDHVNASLVASFDEAKDYQLVHTKTVTAVKSCQGFFTALLPGEIHRNSFLKPYTTKLVFKLLYNG